MPKIFKKAVGAVQITSPSVAAGRMSASGAQIPGTGVRAELSLYRALREAVPIVDAALMKLVRLCGGINVETDCAATDTALADFLRTVPTGRGQRGIDSFLDSYLDSLLTYGRAVGEVVASPERGEIDAVICADPRRVEPLEGRTPLDFSLAGISEKGERYCLPRQELLLFTTLNPEPENPYGVSLLRSLPVYCDTLLKIYNAIGRNWERFGNPRFSVSYKPENGDILDASERVGQIAKEWQNAMQDSRGGALHDFVSVGDVQIRVIGAENAILDAEVPVRKLLEQIVARTGIPPFMLGLSWSTTERMSTQQADILTSELDAIRRTVTPALEQICEIWLRIRGLKSGVKITWNTVNLLDETELARAKLLSAQAVEIERRTGRQTSQ